MTKTRLILNAAALSAAGLLLAGCLDANPRCTGYPCELPYHTSADPAIHDESYNDQSGGRFFRVHGHHDDGGHHDHGGGDHGHDGGGKGR